MTDTSMYEIEIDPKAILRDIENSNKGNDLPKVTWHQLPKDESESNWRFLPYFKNKTFFYKIEKHWDIPGLTSRTVVCPKSFINPETKKPYPCALCEKSYEIYRKKIKEDGDEIIRKALNTQSVYLTNAIDVDNKDKGIGVLALPYAIWQSLSAFLTSGKFCNFFQIKNGSNVWIKPTYQAGTVVPGGSGKQKKNYTIQVTELNPIEDFSILEGLYDLETVHGIPTYQATKGWLQKMLTGDPDAGSEFLTGKIYVNQLTDGTAESEKVDSKEDESDVSFPVHTFTESTPEFAELPTLKNTVVADKITPTTPTTQIGEDGFPVCYSEAFDENNKTCLKCNFAEDCEVSILKRKRQQRAVSSVVSEPVKTEKIEQDDVEAKMLAILNKGK